jgi:hypothetical protein
LLWLVKTAEYPIQNYHCQLGTYAMAFGRAVKIILTVFNHHQMAAAVAAAATIKIRKFPHSI